MVRTLSRYRACRYLAYAAAFVLWLLSVAGQILVGAGRCCARNWREYAETVRDVESSHKPKPCAQDCLSPCCHYGCENVSGHRWEEWPDTTTEEIEEALATNEWLDALRLEWMQALPPEELAATEGILSWVTAGRPCSAYQAGKLAGDLFRELRDHQSVGTGA